MSTPRPRGIKRAVKRARDKVDEAIRDNTDSDSYISTGLASEGFEGGYRQALDDVLLVLNGVTPRTNGYWSDNG